jgi:sec-independent protein translocase protein TatA
MVPQLLQGSEWLIVIVIVVVLIFGAGKIPDLAKSLGRASGEFQKGKVESEMEVAKLRAQGAQAAQPTDSEHDKLLRAAKELGISTDGKTDEQIREEVKKALA